MTILHKGDKIEVSVKIVEVIERFVYSRDGGGAWNCPQRTFKMEDSEGNIYKWFAREAISIGTEGDQVTIRATVKSVTRVNGGQWAEVIRCRKAK